MPAGRERMFQPLREIEGGIQLSLNVAARAPRLRVALERAALADPGEGHYYLADLVGLEVHNEQGERLGTVKQWFSSGSQDMMEVAGSRTRLIPWVSAVVKEVDLGSGRIVVDWGADW